MSEVHIQNTMSWCRHCENTELARIVARPKGVFLERLCSKTGVHSSRLTASHEWYIERAVGPKSCGTVKNPVASREGCPKDCGPCQWHQTDLLLPIFSITNDCNLDCPICFTYNRADLKYYKSLEEVEKIIDHVLNRNPQIQLVDLTGGEPTMHPQLIQIVRYIKSRGIRRVLVNSNGLRIARDKVFAQELKDAGAHIVLSLDTFDADRSRQIHGADICDMKRKTLATLEELQIPTTILTVCIPNVNEDEVASFVGEYLTKSYIRSITVQNMTYTGKNGSNWDGRDRITIDEVESLCATNKGISTDDFFTPGNYHPLCYSQAYYLVHEGKLLSFNKVVGKERMREILKGRYFISEIDQISSEFLEGITRLWASGEAHEELKVFRQIILEMQEASRNNTEKLTQMADQMVKMLCIHPHMDEDNFDVDRTAICGDLVPDETGRMIPACSYNLLYRKQDNRFWVAPQASHE